MGALELEAFADRLAKTYSGDQRRRLDLAMGMVHRPALLFLDEPTTGLDPQSRAHLWDEVRVLRDAGTTVFLTTHYPEEADALCDRLAIMDAGRVRGGYAARALYRWFRQHGPGDVTVEVRPQTFARYELVRLGWLDGTEREALAAGVVSADELDRWHEALATADRDDAFFASLNHLLVAGRKPL